MKNIICNIPFVECDDGNDTSFASVGAPAKPVPVDGPASPIPEPGGVVLAIIGLAIFALWLRRMKKLDPPGERYSDHMWED